VGVISDLDMGISEIFTQTVTPESEKLEKVILKNRIRKFLKQKQLESSLELFRFTDSKAEYWPKENVPWRLTFARKVVAVLQGTPGLIAEESRRKFGTAGGEEIEGGDAVTTFILRWEKEKD
jgi:hypothetical protein